MRFLGLVAGMDEPELASAPLGWQASTQDCPASIVAPRGWKGCVGRQEVSRKLLLVLDGVDERSWLPAGGALAVSVKLARRDPSYRTPVFWAIRSRGASDHGNVTAQPSP